MRHTPDGTLRRLVDEPFAVPDTETEHAARCERCGRRHEEIARNAAAATALLSRPQPLPDVESAWRRLQASSQAAAAAGSAPHSRLPRRPSRRVVVVPLPSRTVLASAAAVVVLAVGGGVTAALVSSPGASRAPTSPTIDALTDVVGLNGNTNILGGFDQPSGSRSLPFGVLRWSSSGAARSVASISAAQQITGLDVKVPANLPSGVGTPSTILVQPAVTATVQFNAAAGSLAGRTLTVTAGPAVVVEFGSTSTSLDGLPTLTVFVMPRPTVAAKDASASQLEAFVLSQRGVPDGLAQELRLLGGVGTVLPIPQSSGAALSQVDVDGASAVLVTDSSLGASGVLWVDQSNLVHAAVGLLDQHDILSVATQIG